METSLQKFSLAVLIVAFGAATAHGAVIFDNGAVQGTALDVSGDTGSVAIVVTDTNLSDNITLIQLDKTFDRYAQEGAGIPPTGLPTFVEISLPSAARAGFNYFDITFSDEQIRNRTGVDWWDFHIVIVPAPGVEVDLFNEPDPITSEYFNQIEGIGPLHGRWHDGVWPSNGEFHTLFQSPPNELFTVRIGLLDNEDTLVLIKEYPSVPEPMTIGLLCIGGVGLLRRRRKRQ